MDHHPIRTFILLLVILTVGFAEVFRPDWEVIAPIDMYENCETVLDERLNVYWTLDGQTIWFALESSALSNTEFMAFGVSGSHDKVKMNHGDVIVADFYNGTARARDYYLQDSSPCDVHRKTGVCPDEVFNGGINDVTNVFGAKYGKDSEEAPTIIHFSRPLLTNDSVADQAWDYDEGQQIIWALGTLDNSGFAPVRHDNVPRTDVTINFKRKSQQNCHSFITSEQMVVTKVRKAENVIPALPSKQPSSHPTKNTNPSVIPKRHWVQKTISDRVLVVALGPTGFDQPAVQYYVNEFPAPIIDVTRGLNYTFQAMVGTEGVEEMFHHPLQIRAGKEVIAGPVQGRLCLWSSSLSKENVPETFEEIAKTLTMSCDAGQFEYFEWTPDGTTPDICQYESSLAEGIGAIIRVNNPSTQSD